MPLLDMWIDMLPVRLRRSTVGLRISHARRVATDRAVGCVNGETETERATKRLDRRERDKSDAH